MSRRIDMLSRGRGRNPAAVVVLQWVAAGVARYGRRGVRQGCQTEAVRWRRGLQGDVWGSRSVLRGGAAILGAGIHGGD